MSVFYKRLSNFFLGMNELDDKMYKEIQVTKYDPEEIKSAFQGIEIWSVVELGLFRYEIHGIGPEHVKVIGNRITGQSGRCSIEVLVVQDGKQKKKDFKERTYIIDIREGRLSFLLQPRISINQIILE